MLCPIWASPSADRPHSAAIHLLRTVRRHDAAGGLSGPRLSALSVAVFAGPLTIGALASAEQVKAPTMTRMVGALERAGLVERRQSTEDHRRIPHARGPRPCVAFDRQGRGEGDPWLRSGRRAGGCRPTPGGRGDRKRRRVPAAFRWLSATGPEALGRAGPSPASRRRARRRMLPPCPPTARAGSSR